VTDVIAHRGASHVARENTVAAFRRAVEMGAQGIELDVRCTADDVLVVHHDPTYIDDQGDSHLIRASMASSLPAHIPTLTQALTACAGAYVNIEIKNSASDQDFDPERRISDLLVAALTAGEQAGRNQVGWVISSFDRESIDRVHVAAPDLVTAWLALKLEFQDLEELVAAGHRGVHPWEVALTGAQVQQAHGFGLFVNAWTCNDPVRMRELAAWGVDGIVTDMPDLGIATLAR
jgi:glycerophosphoryl diester phosphodiesterase